ncbi:glycosyltransferase, partial [Staphylococcus arlettae]
HSSHLGKHNIKSSYKYALKNADKVTQYIVLTHQQKADILANNVITENKISVIPHFIKPVNIDTQLPQQNRFIFIGRLVPEKQIEHIIHAYKKFIAKGYSTTLSIFGSGDANYRSYIETLIDDLELQQKITINEHTNNPIQELQQSKASLLTSQYEGFGLTIMESIEVGCPVISYDIRYGPSEIITHGENGFLVEANNITELTEYMTKIIDSPLKSVETTSTVKYDTAINNYKQLFSLLNDA